MNVVLLDWRPVAKNTLVGFAKVQFQSGLIIAEIAINRDGDKVWATPPARPVLGVDGEVMRERGRIRYQSVIQFASDRVRESWSRQVVRAVRSEFPEALPEDQGNLEV